MNLTLIFLILFLAYGFFYLLPIKMKIHKKNGRILSNLEIRKLAEEGDADAQALKKKGKYLYALGFIFSIFFILEKYKFINF